MELIFGLKVVGIWWNMVGEMSGGLGHKDVRGNSITDKMNVLCA